MANKYLNPVQTTDTLVHGVTKFVQYNGPESDLNVTYQVALRDAEGNETILAEQNHHLPFEQVKDVIDGEITEADLGKSYNQIIMGRLFKFLHDNQLVNIS